MMECKALATWFGLDGVPREIICNDIDVHFDGMTVRMGSSLFDGAVPDFYARITKVRIVHKSRFAWESHPALQLHVKGAVDIGGETARVRVRVILRRVSVFSANQRCVKTARRHWWQMPWYVKGWLDCVGTVKYRDVIYYAKMIGPHTLLKQSESPLQVLFKSRPKYRVDADDWQYSPYVDEAEL